MLADRPRAVAALTKIFLTEIERLIDAAAAADILASENSGFSVDASVRITLLDRDVRSYFSKPRTLAAVLRPAALRARTPLRDPWPRRPHQSDPLRAAPTQGGQLGRAGSRAEVDAAGSQRRRRAHAAPSFSTGSPISSRRRGSTPASLPRGLCPEPQAQAGRDRARLRKHRQAVRLRCRRAWGRRSRHGRRL